MFSLFVIEQTFVTPLDCYWNLCLRKWQLCSRCFAQFWPVHLLQNNRTNFHCGSLRPPYRLKKYRIWLMLFFLLSVIEKSPSRSYLSFITQNRLRVKNYYRDHIIKKITVTSIQPLMFQGEKNSVKRSNFWSCTFYPYMYFHFHARIKLSVGKMIFFQWFFIPNKITAAIKSAFCRSVRVELFEHSRKSYRWCFWI